MENFEEVIQYTYHDRSLLQEALTHSSYSNEGKKGMRDNERLEFLGDSVLSLVVAEYLFAHYRHQPEGELTKLRAALVCEQSLFQFAQKIDLGEYIRVGKGEEHTGGRNRPSILSDAFEAVIASIYLDGGFEEAQTVIIRLYEPMLSQLTPTTLGKDAKTNLQEVLQRMHYGLPLYDIVEIRGAPHDQEFEVRVDIPDLGISLTGVGKSRRQAEQDAAQKALDSEAIRNLKG